MTNNEIEYITEQLQQLTDELGRLHRTVRDLRNYVTFQLRLLDE